MPQSQTESAGEHRTGQIRLSNQAAIVRAAEAEFATRGFKGASMQRIADAAGIPRPNVHYYFKSKLDLYVSVLSDIVNLWNDQFDQISNDDDPAEAIGAYIRAKVMYSKTNPEASRIFASEIIHGAPNLTKYLKKDFRTWIREKASIMQSWIEQGKMDPVDPVYLIFLIWSSTQHYADFDVQVRAVLGKNRLNSKDFEAISANLEHIILKGCGIHTKSKLAAKHNDICDAA